MANDFDEEIILGPEHDRELPMKLRSVLKNLGGVKLSQDWGVGGSQEITTWVFQIGDQQVTVGTETYMGLSIRGPRELVERIGMMVRGPEPCNGFGGRATKSEMGRKRRPF